MKRENKEIHKMGEEDKLNTQYQITEAQKIKITRHSERIQEKIMEDLEVPSKSTSRKRAAEGNINQNSFSILSDVDIMNVASNMGVNIDSNHFAIVDMMKDLEEARQALHDKKITVKMILMKIVRTI